MLKSLLARCILAIIVLLAIIFTSSCPPPPTLTIVIQPTSGGSATPPSGSRYENGVVVQVVASPSAGYRFDRWEGGASGSSQSVNVTMDKSKTVTAYFIKQYNLSVSATPSNGGSISPGSKTYDEGQTVTLIANPSQYYQFNGWGGDVSGTSSQITVVMDSNKTVVASFKKVTYTLQTSIAAPGGGTIDPANGTFDAGTTQKITAFPAAGYRFNRWEGSASGSSSILNLVMDMNKNITAFFTRVFKLNTAISPNGSGTVSLNPNTGSFDEGSKVSVTATAVFPYFFNNWTGTDNDSNNPSTVTMSADKTVAVTFLPTIKGEEKKASGYLDAELGRIATYSIPIELKKYEWVQGEITLDASPIKAEIQDPNGKIMGSYSSTTSFSFQAETPGRYTITFTSTTIFARNWALKYTIYRLP